MRANSDPRERGTTWRELRRQCTRRNSLSRLPGAAPAVSFAKRDYGGAGTFEAISTRCTPSVPVSPYPSTPAAGSKRISKKPGGPGPRRAEYRDLGGRVKYDSGSHSWTRPLPIERKGGHPDKALAERALLQSQDRYSNGVTDYLEVVQAGGAGGGKRELYSKPLLVQRFQDRLARAMGGAETSFKTCSEETDMTRQTTLDVEETAMPAQAQAEESLLADGEVTSRKRLIKRVGIILLPALLLVARWGGGCMQETLRAPTTRRSMAILTPSARA